MIDMGLNMTINLKHRIEVSVGIPFFSKGRYNSDEYANVAVTREFSNLYYGISYVFLFDL
ncbi:hypothetical protein [Helicobacter sp. 12S02232-10]|uniref:hypothetical protein n=1 Tax=Helicobacter sp. 12S02232-10 TaxID=1476197 RepID=UPI002150EC91|nr:hypothetical protein [Helicobacter sp. 12S02232-10]